jgi:glycosyltransferase involved in cell wall biosynthesis
MAPSTISLVVTTYEWPCALSRVLASVARQSRLPDEVIVADDGSGPATASLLAQVAATFPVPLRHCWQEDDGFRAARSRNLAIAAAGGEYVLLVDGDMVLHPRFVADHCALARHGMFVQGSRVLLDQAFSARMLLEPALVPGFLGTGCRRRRHTLRIPALSGVYGHITGPRPRSVKTCNQGWWREDLLRLNGFDERMRGWGREDEELAARAWHAGIGCRQVRLAALAFHLHHVERHCNGASPNDVFLAQTVAERRVRCDAGVSDHLAASRLHPPADLRTAR